jgi:hypothetical protein
LKMKIATWDLKTVQEVLGAKGKRDQHL